MDRAVGEHGEGERVAEELAAAFEVVSGEVEGGGDGEGGGHCGGVGVGVRMVC